MLIAFKEFVHDDGSGVGDVLNSSCQLIKHKTTKQQNKTITTKNKQLNVLPIGYTIIMFI